jgi:transposase
MTKTNRSSFSPEFRLKTAQLLVDQGYSNKEAASSVDVGLHEKLALVERLSQSGKRQYSVKHLCEVLGVHRSTFRYWQGR